MSRLDIRMETRSKADVGNEKSGTKGPVDHSYNKWQEKVKSNQSDMSKNEKCVDSKKSLKSNQKRSNVAFVKCSIVTSVQA